MRTASKLRSALSCAAWRRRRIGFVFTLAVGLNTATLTAQTLNTTFDIAPTGTVDATVEMTFDAAAWNAWKVSVGNEPARLRATMRHQMAAQFLIDDFKLEKDDLNRTAKLVIRSAVGPTLSKTGDLRIPVEKEFKVVTNTDRTWFFSGNNRLAGNTLNTIKVLLPENVQSAALVNVGESSQALVFTLKKRADKARSFLWFGSTLLALGALVVGADVMRARRSNAA